MSEQSRITVVGSRRRVDVAVPSWTPIGEYADRLATICGQERNDVMPPVWSLATVGEAALPLDTSLAGAGVADGQVLYLKDTAREPVEAPIVAEIDEVVADETQRLRGTRLHAGPATIAAGLLWLTGTAVMVAWRTGGGVGGAMALIVSGLLLIGGAWGLSQQKDLVPYAMRLTIALTSVPVVAAGGVLAGHALTTGGYPWESGLIGANLAGLLALASLPEAALFAVQIELFLALVTAVLIRGFEADRAGAAAVTSVVATATLAMSRRISAMVAAWSRNRQASRTGPTDMTIELVGHARSVLSVVVAGPALALSIALPVLAAMDNAFALALMGAVCLALLVWARHSAFTSEVIAVGLTVTIGGFSLFLALLREIGLASDGFGAVMSVFGLVVVAVGAGLCVLTPKMGTEPPRGPGKPAGPKKRNTMDVFGQMATMAMTPLAMGVFGVFGKLFHMGRTMF
jgi:ESX secretion system protein EccD